MSKIKDVYVPGHTLDLLLDLLEEPELNLEFDETPPEQEFRIIDQNNNENKKVSL